MSEKSLFSTLVYRVLKLTFYSSFLPCFLTTQNYNQNCSKEQKILRKNRRNHFKEGESDVLNSSYLVSTECTTIRK